MSSMTAEEYDAKRKARYERLLAAADRAESAGNAAQDQARAAADLIPLGQPILIGHHSEKADRRYRERYQAKFRRGYDLHKKAAALRDRAEAMAKNRAIFSDDPAAGEKIEDRIALLEQRQAMMKAANVLIRKGDRAGLAGMGFSDQTIDKLLTPLYGRAGFPAYALTNNGANIRRLKDRLKVIAAHAADQTTERAFGDIRLIDNVEANRLQIIFPGKPPDAVRAALKSAGFRWAPSENAWQRHRSNPAMYQAKQIIAKHYPEKESANE